MSFDSTTEKGGFNPALTTITTVATPSFGAWIAYYADRSGVVVFQSEIDALRHAVEHSMQVGYVKFGADVWETLAGTR